MEFCKDSGCVLVGWETVCVAKALDDVEIVEQGSQPIVVDRSGKCLCDDFFELIVTDCRYMSFAVQTCCQSCGVRVVG